MPSTSVAHVPPPDEPLWSRRLERGLKVFQAALTLGSMVLALRAFSASRDVNKLAIVVKRMETVEHFIDRFYDIHRTKQSDPEFYYERLYGLHSEEYRHYKIGLIDKDTYLSWLLYRHRDYHNSPDVEKREWDRVSSHHLVDQEFIKFMGQILKIPDDKDTAKTKDLIEKHLHTVVRTVLD